MIRTFDTWEEAEAFHRSNPPSYDYNIDEAIESEKEEKEPELPAWVKKYRVSPGWFKNTFPGHDEDPCNFWVVVLALKTSPLFSNIQSDPEVDTHLSRASYWYSEDPEFRAPLDRLLFDFFQATGEDSEAAADDVYLYCFQMELPRVPSPDR